MNPDRSTPPVEFRFSKIEFPKPKLIQYSSGLKLHYFNTPGSNAFKIEFILRNANSFNESHLGTNLLISKLFLSGTSLKNASTISELLAQKGAFIDVSPSFDYTSITIHCLKKYVIEVLNIVSEIFQDIKFKEEELELQKSILNSNYNIQQKKNNVVASQKFRRILFNSYPYGNTPNPDYWNKINEEQLGIDFNKYWNDFEIISIGDHDKSIINYIDSCFKPQLQKNFFREIKKADKSNSNVETVKIGDSIQTTIKIGKLTLSKSHKDYPALLMTNYILGGFFGSRLMKNIREDKGLTYGIYSSIVTLNNYSYFVISSDVEASKKELAIKEILKEINTLINKSLSKIELLIAKNHWLGSFQNDLSSALSLNDKFKNYYLFGLPDSYYENLITNISYLTTSDIQFIANKYLQPDSMSIIKVGG